MIEIKKQIHGSRLFPDDKETLLILGALQRDILRYARSAKEECDPKKRYADLQNLATLVILYDSLEKDASIPF